MQPVVRQPSPGARLKQVLPVPVAACVASPQRGVAPPQRAATPPRAVGVPTPPRGGALQPQRSPTPPPAVGVPISRRDEAAPPQRGLTPPRVLRAFGGPVVASPAPSAVPVPAPVPARVAARPPPVPVPAAAPAHGRDIVKPVEGSLVEYYSVSNGCWIPTFIIHVDAETGSVKTDLKPNSALPLQEQPLKLRPRRRPSKAQLDWNREVLSTEGRLEREALALFSRFAGARLPRQPAAFVRLDDMPALGNEVDAKLGITGSVCTLRERCERSSAGAAPLGLTLEAFGEALWDLLWGVQKEFCQALPRGRTTQHRHGSLDTDYEFVPGKLGTGTYGVVRLAKERSSGSLRAVKIVKRTNHYFGSADELDSELEYLRVCDHPHIVKLYEHYVDDANIYLVMDYCSGGELQAVIRKAAKAKRTIPEYFTSAVMRQILLAIAHVHARGIVHLDLKSANVMLMPSRSTLPPGRGGDASPSSSRAVEDGQLFDRQPHAMVIDLGVAQLFRPGQFRNNRPMGTPSTMAPEVWMGEITPKADVFSCGVVLFELLSRSLPFACGADRLKAIDYWGTLPEPPRQKLVGASQIAADLCRTMLALERNKRPTAAQCLRTPFLQPRSGTTEPPVQLLEGLVNVSKRSLLQKSVALAIARAWPANRLPTIKRLFEELDKDGSGQLNKHQICAALERLGMDKQSSLEAADAMDLSRDGTVDWTEFVAACVQLSSDTFDADLERIFKQADSDGDGLLSKEDISKLLGADHLRGDAVNNTFVDLIGRTEHGRVDWPTFQKHFRLQPGAGVDSNSRTTSGDQGRVADRRPAGLLPADFLEQAFGWLEQAREAFWPRLTEPGEPGEPPEDVLKHLTEMGFTNRERCVAILKRHHNNMSSPGLFEALLRSTAEEDST